MGGDAENFEQFVILRSARDVARVSRTVVDILASALDYRGQQALTVELGAGVHGPMPEVHDSLTPTQVVKVMSGQGHSVITVENDDATALRFHRRGINTAVELSDRCNGTRSFWTMGLTCELEPRAEDVTDSPPPHDTSFHPPPCRSFASGRR